MSETITTTTEWKLARKYFNGGHHVFVTADDLDVLLEHRARLLASKPWMEDEFIVLKSVITTTTTQENL